MASPTREEIQRRIATDDGNPDDTVYVPSSRAKSSVTSYHSRVQCQTIPVETECEPFAREYAQELGKAPCKVCVLEDVAENPGPQMANKLEQMDPEDVGLSRFPPSERATDSD